MTWISIIANLSTIMGLIKAVEALVAEVVKTKSVPDLASVLPLLDEVEKIFKAGIIQIPGVNDADIANAIQMIRDQLSPPAPAAAPAAKP